MNEYLAHLCILHWGKVKIEKIPVLREKIDGTCSIGSDPLYGSTNPLLATSFGQKDTNGHDCEQTSKLRL